MAQLDVQILGKSYSILCDGAEEAHIKLLLEYLQQRMDDVKATTKGQKSVYILIMAALLICDDLFSAKAELESLQGADKDVDLQQLRGKLKQLHLSLEGLCKQVKIE